MKKYILIFISFCTIHIMNAQDYSKYFKNLKNIVRLNECKSNDFNNKNKNIQCFDENLSNTVNHYFETINSIKFDSINSGRQNYFQTVCEVKYSKTGKMIDFKISDYKGSNQLVIEQNKKKVTEILQSLEKIIQLKYKIVDPAIDYKNQTLESIIPLSISVKVVNGKILLKYNNAPNTNLMDYYDYSNEQELKTFYSLVYDKIENTFDKDFQSIAENNNIKACFAHLYFEVSENGKIENIKNVQKGEKVFEEFLKDQLLKNIDQIKDSIIIAKLPSGEKIKKTYLMSFKFGFKK
jgi:hypothetical protein